MKRVLSAAASLLAATIALGADAAPRLGAGANAAASEPVEDLVKPDPAVLIGKLPNGMRYAIARTVGLPEVTIGLPHGRRAAPTRPTPSAAPPTSSASANVLLGLGPFSARNYSCPASRRSASGSAAIRTHRRA